MVQPRLGKTVDRPRSIGVDVASSIFGSLGRVRRSSIPSRPISHPIPTAPGHWAQWSDSSAVWASVNRAPPAPSSASLAFTQLMKVHKWLALATLGHSRRPVRLGPLASRRALVRESGNCFPVVVGGPGFNDAVSLAVNGGGVVY